MKYTVEQVAPTRTFYTYAEPCKLGGRLIVDITEVHPDNSSKHSLPRLWKEHGYLPHVLNSYLSVNTYAEDADGRCWGKFNPQIAPVGTKIVKVWVCDSLYTGAGHYEEKTVPDSPKLDFQWMLEATPENREKILQEIERRAF